MFRTMSKLDAVDLDLLRALSADPRATVVALAEKLGLSRNTVQARMSRLERGGVFLSYERTLSAEALGLQLLTCRAKLQAGVGESAIRV